MLSKTTKFLQNCPKFWTSNSFFVCFQALFAVDLHLPKGSAVPSHRTGICARFWPWKVSKFVFREGLWRCFSSVFHLFCSALRELVLAYPLFPALPKLLACIFLLVLSWKKRATSLPEIFGDTFLLPNQFSLLSAGNGSIKNASSSVSKKPWPKALIDFLTPEGVNLEKKCLDIFRQI